MQDKDAIDEMDPVWKALANPFRRAILERLHEGPMSTGQLASHFDEHSRFAVMQHLRVLTDADLVVVRSEGRSRFNYFNPIPVQLIYDKWVGRHIQPWANALVDLRNELEAAKPITRDRGL